MSYILIRMSVQNVDRSGDITIMLSRLCQKAGKRNEEDKMLNILITTYLCFEGKMLRQIRLVFHCNKKFNVQIQPYLNKIKHVFLFLCSVVKGLPTTTKAPPPSQKWVRGKQVRGGGGLNYLVSESSHSMTIQPQKRLWPLFKGL